MTEETKKRNWTKPVKRGSKSTKNLKKLYLIILILFIVLLFLKNYVKKHAIDSVTIHSLVGNNVSVNVGSKVSLIIRENTIVPFTAFLKAGNYESAYNMCIDEYKEFFSLQEFANTFSMIDPTSLALKEVKAKTDYCYEAKVVYRLLEDKKTETNASGELVEVEGKQYETTFMLFPNELNPEVIQIAPNKFLYGYKDQTFKKEGIKLHVDRCVVFTDHVELNGTIQNTSWFSTIKLNSIGLGYEEGLLRKFGFQKTLEKGEEVDISHTITDTNFFMPDNIQIEKYKNEKKLRKYTFYFEEGK